MVVNKTKVYVMGILILVLIIFTIVSYSKNCKSDDSCFDAKAFKCSRAKVLHTDQDNLYKYEIKGSEKDGCIMTVHLIKLSEKTGPNLKEVLEGKGMVCEFPKSLLQERSVFAVENVNDYCTGPLKEALLQVTVDKLYEIIVKNFGESLVEIHGVSSI